MAWGCAARRARCGSIAVKSLRTAGSAPIEQQNTLECLPRPVVMGPIGAPTELCT